MSDKQYDAEVMAKEIRDNYKKLPDEVEPPKNRKKERAFEEWYAERCEEEESIEEE